VTPVRNRIRSRLRTQYHERLLPKLREGLAETPLIYGSGSRSERQARVRIASKTGLNDVLLNVMSGTITIEEHAFFGHGVLLLTGTHDPACRGVERMLEIPREGGDIIVETGAWIGSSATVLGPCRIGAHAVVCAGSVVRADVAPGEIVGGVPARHIGWVPGASPGGGDHSAGDDNHASANGSHVNGFGGAIAERVPDR
jgi:acetyltransferase-like isoleucine patch superfamily enzyme